MSDIADPKSYFRKLGGLHDARVEGLQWLKKNQRLSIWVDDVNSNFADSPGYAGVSPAELLFERVEELDIGLQITAESFSIYELKVNAKGSGFTVSIDFAPGGQIQFACASVVVAEKQQEGGSA